MRSCYVLIYLRLAVFFIIIIISNFQKYFFQQKSIFFTIKGVHRKKSRGLPICVKRKKSPPPPGAPMGGGQNLNCKFKTFGFIDTLKLHKLQANTLQYCISLSNKTRRKNQQTIQFQV